MRLAIVVSHPVQYYTPVFRALARRCDLHVFYGQQLSAEQQGADGFKGAFTWDVDLLAGYASTTLRNVSRTPGTNNFVDCNTPEIGARLKAGGFDAVLVMGWYLKSYVQALLAAKRQRLPVLVRGDSHLEMPRSELKRHAKALVNPLFLRLFDSALYVGEKSRAFYQHYRYPASRLFFSPHCVDNDFFSARATAEARARVRRAQGISKDAFVVLFAGKLVPSKRPLDVIEAASLVSATGCSIEVMVAGSGDLDGAVKQRAEDTRVPLHALGFCNQTDMPAAYAAADALVLPSSSETWGLVANEALACGRPVIVSDACGCAPDLAADGKAGRVTPLGDTEAIAAAIGDIMDRPPLAADIRARVESYSIARAVEGIIQAAEAIRGGSAKGRTEPNDA